MLKAERINMDYTVDRIEGEYAVLVSLADSSVTEVKLGELNGAKEGEVFRQIDNRFVRLDGVAEKRKSELSARFEKLKRK